MKIGLLPLLCCAAILARAEWEFDAGADLRVRQEIYDNVPGLPGGGYLSQAAYGKTRNHMRFRPAVWGELKNTEKFRVFARFSDEFRWNVNYRNRTNEFPDELILENLFVESKGLFDGLLDFRVGRQNLVNYCGLPHLFVDGTPGDGSRTCFSDMANATLHFDERNSLDVFGLNNRDVNRLRWGTEECEERSLTGRGDGASGGDWGYGAIHTLKCGDLEFRTFAIAKKAESKGHVETFGENARARLGGGCSAQVEGMAQDDGEWSAYAAFDWKNEAEGWKPFAGLSVRYMSEEWDPMWSRAENDSAMWLYGTHNGVGWWSNMIFVKPMGGIEFGRRHSLTVFSAPVFAAEQDGLGGGNGRFKGLLSQANYCFPLILPDRKAGERFEMFGHLLVEFFNPGDYYESDRPAWFVRWQVEMRF